MALIPSGSKEQPAPKQGVLVLTLTLISLMSAADAAPPSMTTQAPIILAATGVPTGGELVLTLGEVRIDYPGARDTLVVPPNEAASGCSSGGGLYGWTEIILTRADKCALSLDPENDLNCFPPPPPPDPCGCDNLCCCAIVYTPAPVGAANYQVDIEEAFIVFEDGVSVPVDTPDSVEYGSARAFRQLQLVTEIREDADGNLSAELSLVAPTRLRGTIDVIE